jgi:hypothetical protein
LPRHWPALLAVLLALLLRGGVPEGYMIGTDQSGSVTIQLCSGRTMVMPMPMGHGDHHGQPREMPCPFGVLGAPAMPSAPPVVVGASLVIAPTLLAAALPAFLQPQAAAPPPPSTGPPAFA